MPSTLSPPVIFQVASYCRPPRGQKSQQSEQPVHILTSSGRSSSPMPMESVGQAATQTPHCTQRSASMTACSRRSEERRVGKSVDLGGRRIIKKKKEHRQLSRWSLQISPAVF